MDELKKILKPLASLKLTVVLLVLSMLLIYAGTWAQVDMGIWEVQKKYFHSLWVWVPLQTLWPRGDVPINKAVGFPLPGGYLLGGLMLLNLIAAHTTRFQFTARRIGINLIHLGLILLLVGEGVASTLQKESFMRIEEGSFAVYAQDNREPELAIVELGDQDAPDTQHVIGVQLLETGRQIADARLPFDVKIDEFFQNSDLADPARHPDKPFISREGERFTIEKKDPTGGTENRSDFPGAFVTLRKAGQPVGSFALNTGLTFAQSFAVDGKTYSIALRPRRYYKPYKIHLNKFAFDRYTGTELPRNFSSDVHLIDPVNKEERQFKISMNNPLRYRGEVFYQHSFDNVTEKATVLQVVRNPGWLLPYIAIGIAGLGLIDHFLIVLAGFLLRRQLTRTDILGGHLAALTFAVLIWLGYGLGDVWGLVGAVFIGFAAVGMMIWRYVATMGAAKAARPPKPILLNKELKPDRIVEMAPTAGRGGLMTAAIIALICAAWVAYTAMPRKMEGQYNYDQFAKLPTSFGGRIQPMETLARNSLKILRGKETAIRLVASADASNPTRAYIPAAQWMLDVMSNRALARKDQVIRLDNPYLKALVGVTDPDRRYFSYEEIKRGEPKMAEQLEQASQVEERNSQKLSDYQRDLLALARQLRLYERLEGLEQPLVVPPAADGKSDWMVLGNIPLDRGDGRPVPLGRLGAEAMSMLGSTPDMPLREFGLPPARWLAEAMTAPEKARHEAVFRITHPELIKVLELSPRQSLFALDDIRKGQAKLAQLIEETMKADPQSFTPVQRAVADLTQKLDVYRQIESMGNTVPAGTAEFLRMLNAYRNENPAEFNRLLDQYARLAEGRGDDAKRARFEAWFNRFAPFSQAQVLYLVAFGAVIFSWMGWRRHLGPTAFGVLVLAILVHLTGMIARMVITHRPPVTNLASSAIFIGLAAAICAGVLELMFRNTLGSFCATVIGYLTLLTADKLALSGDTMEPLRAVLDTNIWLTTHVITITLGYSATYLAGLLGVIYIVMGVFTRELDQETHKTLGRMIWAVTCFAILFSFIGTILGGIWADQSWGRFWGWDPKENGAVLIVLANAIVLHARWAGWARERGLANLAILGIIVTSWSWFGTNMLGVGLHAYGFMGVGMLWTFIALLLILPMMLVGVGMIPIRHWASAAHLWNAKPSEEDEVQAVVVD